VRPQERFTSDEIKQTLAEVATDLEEVDLGADSEENHHFFICEYGSIRFNCLLISTTPFHDQMMLSAYRWTTDNPFELSNKFGDDAYLARSIVKLNDDGTLFVDEDGDFEIKAELFIPFAGTVTPEHLQFLIQMWAEDLIAFYGFEPDEDSQDAPEAVGATDAEASLHDHLLNTLLGSPAQTARQLAKSLGVTRNDVNRTLYASPELFARDSSQPPRWSVVEP
jgi:hypothetical protein